MTSAHTDDREEHEKLPLSKAAEFLLDECRMVLPGIQALFGFQLIAVFSPGFSEKLDDREQALHVLAIAFVAIAVALIMTPAALHRQAGSRDVSDTFIRVSTWLLLLSMLPLAASICLDFYLIARLVFGNEIARLSAVGLFVFFVVMWFVFPRARRLHGSLSKKR